MVVFLKARNRIALLVLFHSMAPLPSIEYSASNDAGFGDNSVLNRTIVSKLSTLSSPYSKCIFLCVLKQCMQIGQKCMFIQDLTL